MTWLDWLGVAAAVGLAGYIAWGIWRLRVIDWPNLDEDLEE